MWCEGKITYPAEYALIRVFKLEQRCDIWARNDSMSTMQLIHSVPICDMDFLPGPKLKRGDLITPEGIYWSYQVSYTKNPSMWINLEDGHIDDENKIGTGYLLKLCLNYPDPIDNLRTREIGSRDAGGPICLHGNCHSEGCVSYKNRDFLPVFAFMMHHNAEEYGAMQVQLYPFDFSAYPPEAWEKLLPEYIHRWRFPKKRLFILWENLAFADSLFKSNLNRVRYDESGVFQKGYGCPQIKELKKWLKDNHGYSSEIDCWYDGSLEEAIRAFQKKSRIEVDGKIGPQTIKTLKKAGFTIYPERQYKKNSKN